MMFTKASRRSRFGTETPSEGWNIGRLIQRLKLARSNGHLKTHNIVENSIINAKPATKLIDVVYTNRIADVSDNPEPSISMSQELLTGLKGKSINTAIVCAQSNIAASARFSSIARATNVTSMT